MTRAETSPGAGLRLRRVVPLPRERVWRAWTEVDLLARWWTDEHLVVEHVDIDLRPGGAFRIDVRPGPGAVQAGVDHLGVTIADEVGTITGTYVEVVPHERLSFTWRFDAFDTGETVVSVELREHRDGTEVVVRHDRLPSADLEAFHAWGWERFLGRLADAA